MVDSSKWLGGLPLTQRIAGSSPLSTTRVATELFGLPRRLLKTLAPMSGRSASWLCLKIGVWAKGEPPVLGTGYQVGSIPTTPAMVGKPA